MRPSAVLRLALSLPACKKGKIKAAKTDLLLVDCKSVVTDCHLQRVRPKLADKLEFLGLDPLVGQQVLFKETKKIRTLPMPRRGGKAVWERLQIQHDAKRQQQDFWYRLQDSEGRTWGEGANRVQTMARLVDTLNRETEK